MSKGGAVDVYVNASVKWSPKSYIQVVFAYSLDGSSSTIMANKPNIDI